MNNKDHIVGRLTTGYHNDFKYHHSDYNRCSGLVSPTSPVLDVAFPSVLPVNLLLLLPHHLQVVPVNLLLLHHHLHLKLLLPHHLQVDLPHLSIKCCHPIELHLLHLLLHHQPKEPRLSGIKTSVISSWLERCRPHKTVPIQACCRPMAGD